MTPRDEPFSGPSESRTPGPPPGRFVWRRTLGITATFLSIGCLSLLLTDWFNVAMQGEPYSPARVGASTLIFGLPIIPLLILGVTLVLSARGTPSDGTSTEALTALGLATALLILPALVVVPQAIGSFLKLRRPSLQSTTTSGELSTDREFTVRLLDTILAEPDSSNGYGAFVELSKRLHTENMPQSWKPQYAAALGLCVARNSIGKLDSPECLQALRGLPR
ncbi:MAG: hypothetical protein U0Q12_22105 [Vicinamibacterales bacterium]